MDKKGIIFDANEKMKATISRLIRLRRPDLYSVFEEFDNIETEVLNTVNIYESARILLTTMNSEVASIFEENYRFLTNLCDGNFRPDEYLIGLWDEGRTSRMRGFYAQALSKDELADLLSKK